MGLEAKNNKWQRWFNRIQKIRDMLRLEDLALKYGTDKNMQHHAFTQYYERREKKKRQL